MRDILIGMPVSLLAEIKPDQSSSSASHFRDWASHVEDFFYIREPQGRILFCSPAYERIWGRTVESLYKAPRSWQEALHPEDHDRIVLASQKPEGFQDDYRIIRPNGDLRWVRSRSYFVKGALGEIDRIIGFAEDITEWKRLEQQLVQSQKMDAVGRLAGGIAHDFNNLLTVINGYSAMVDERADLPEDLRQDIASIRKAGLRAAQLTGQLLAFSRKRPLSLKSIEMVSAVREVEPILRRLIREDVELSILPSSGQLCVCVDPTQFEQVIMNLVINARDAIEGRGSITVECHEEYFDLQRALMHPGCPPGRYAMLAVSDTGHGMDAQTQERIFEPFFSTKESGQGTGLGLATVYSVVRQSSGAVWVYSEVGIGSTFRVYLPLVAPKTTDEPLPSAPRRVEQGTGTVLVVEDEEQVRNLACAALRARGYRVFSAANGEDALILAGTMTDAIDILVTDVIMPRMGGPELVSRLVPVQPGMSVLYISGYTENAMVNASAVPPGLEYLPKPFTPNVLAQKVGEMLKRK